MAQIACAAASFSWESLNYYGEKKIMLPKSLLIDYGTQKFKPILSNIYSQGAVSSYLCYKLK